MEVIHKPVLLEECIDNLNINENGIYIDCTIGGAGHSGEIYKKLSKKGLLIGIDQDNFAIELAGKNLGKLKGQAKFILVNRNFRYILDICKNINISEVDGILMDLGVSSFQLDYLSRGFSYKEDTVLDMRMDGNNKITAEHIINEYSEVDLNRIIKDYGEEKWAKRISKFIVKERAKKRIKSTYELVRVIKSAIPLAARHEGSHPAKRTFQAIRIEVNDELNILRKSLEDVVKLLKSGGRALIITFHSLEDRIVKQIIKDMENACNCPRDFPVCICNRESLCKRVNKRPIRPSDDELKSNSRAKSAKLRILERL